MAAALRRSAPRLPRFVIRLVKGLAILAGLVALGLGSAYVAMDRVLEKNRVEVPRVVGLDSVAATTLLKEVGLIPRIAAEEFSQKIPKGHVTRQRPVRGTRVEPASEVRLFLSRGTDRVEVPDIAGSSLPQAQRSLAEAGLSMGRVTKVHSDLHPRDTVVAQEPSPGATAIRGAPVALLESVGPWEEGVTMPDLVGRDTVTALNLLRELQVESQLSFETTISGKNHVVAQDPPPGHPIKVGDRVLLTIGE
jgi:beta-lactam-binding protein with PASTA domain